MGFDSSAFRHLDGTLVSMTALPLTVPSTETLYWCAGLLEGEGSFHGKRRGTNELRVTCQMTDFDVIDRLHQALGGHVWYPQLSGNQIKRSAIWSSSTTGHAREIMLLVKPLMGARRSAKIEEVLAEYELNGGARRARELERNATILRLWNENPRPTITAISEQAKCSRPTVYKVINT